MRLPTLCCLTLLASLFLIPVAAQQLPTKEQKDEIDKVFDGIKKAHENGAADDSDEIKKLKTKAIELVDKYYKIPHDHINGDPTYDPGLNAEGSTGQTAKDKKKVKTRMGEPAFTTPGWLASSKLHEIVGHGGQAASGRWYTDAKGDAINEVECYDLEIENAKKTGLTDAEIQELKDRRKAYYDKLDEANQKKVDKKVYTVAMAAPPDKSAGELAGNGQVFVAGTVDQENVTAVTVRGPRTFEGVVVEVEANGKQVKSSTDAKGHVLLDLGALGTVAGGTVATVRALDASGKPLATSKTTLQPESAPPIARPRISKIPQQLRNSDVVTLKGSNLGAEAKLVVGGQAQETLSASPQEMTTFVSAPPGQQPAYVVTPFGVSQSQNTQVYTFVLGANKSSITKGEHVTATAQYAGLPPGSKITFTNATPQVVNMRAQGKAVTTGQQSVVTVTQPNGTVTLDLMGESAGAFVIHYDVEFPH